MPSSPPHLSHFTDSPFFLSPDSRTDTPLKRGCCLSRQVLSCPDTCPKLSERRLSLVEQGISAILQLDEILCVTLDCPPDTVRTLFEGLRKGFNVLRTPLQNGQQS